MADSCLTCIHNLRLLLDGIHMDSPIHLRNWSENHRAYSTWVRLYAQEMLAYTASLLCYISDWNGDDRAQDLASLLAEIEAALTDLEAGFQADCAEADENRQGDKLDAILRLNDKIVDHMYPQVWNVYDTLANWVRPPMSQIVFNEFVESIQAYLESIPAQLDAYFPHGRSSNVIKMFRSNILHKGFQENDWPSSQVHEYVAAIVKKLETLKCFLQNFANRCTEKEKLQPFLAGAGALVFSVPRLAWELPPADNHSFTPTLLRTLSGLSGRISPHNQAIKDIHRGVLEGYVEILNTLKPSSPSIGSLTVEENTINSFIAFVLSTKNRVDILYDALAFPLVDLVDTQGDVTDELIELFLKPGIVALVREAGCLDQSILIDETPSDLVDMGTNSVFSTLFLKIKLIKAEIFLLALHHHKADLMVHVTDQGSSFVVAVRKSMRLLCEFFKTPQLFLEDSEKLILALIEDVLREATLICKSYQAESITKDVISESSVAILKLFKAEATLMVLINHTDSTAFLSSKYQIQSLHKGLILFRELLQDPLNKNLEDANLSTFLGAMASEAAYLVCSFGNREISEDLNTKMDILLSCLPRMIDLNVGEIKALYKPSPWSLFSSLPKSDGFGFLGILLEELREFLTRKPDIVAFMQDQVQMFMKELELVMSLVHPNLVEQLNEDTDLRIHIICLIYEAEYIIDLFVTGGVPSWYHQLVIFNVVLETKVVKAKVSELYDKKKLDFTTTNVALRLKDMTVEAATTPNVDEVIVGVNDQAHIIINQLRTGTQHLDIVSVVGMAGLGKTTLAKKVYGDTSVAYHFRIRAWCCVSQVYRRRELILEILGCFVELTAKIMEKDDDDLALVLYQALKQKRFLIVMDDVWTIAPWNELKGLFPDDENGSRVLFTSRLGDVALQVNPKRKPHPLRLLDHKESWELLQDRVFHDGSCPEELLEVCGQIASSCNGLPLVIVVVAGLLKGRAKQKSWWDEIARSLRSHILDDPNEQVMLILEKSYNHLPHYLKPCFLYLGAFLEDREISVERLKLLWIAEGFVPKVECKSFEETAERYMEELIGRSLVMETKRRSKGGTKACRMHDMTRDFCIEKARRENFMQLVSRNVNDDSKSCCYPSVSTFVQYRLCVHSTKEDFVELLPVVGPHTHSLMFFAIKNERDLKEPYDLNFIPHNFKLVRVLELEGISHSLGEIELMFRLRYLAIKGEMKSIPASISKLWNLETLIVKGKRGEIKLPETLWSMEKLRHVQVYPRASFALPGNESVVLANLSTLSSPAFSHEEDTEQLLASLIGLKKLRCIFLGNSNETPWRYNVFPAMAILTQLESLKILYHGWISFPCEFSFPKNLKKLSLSRFRLPWEYISGIITQLTNLEVLKLLSSAFEGETWDMAEGEEFPNLKFLKLYNLNLSTWKASSNHFPLLERLVVQNCKKLEEVPSSFGEIPTLQMIEMYWCSESAAKSVETINEQQLDFQNEDFKFIIS